MRIGTRALWALVGGLLIVQGIVQGCTKDGSSDGAADGAKGERGTIALSVLTMTNPFFQVIAESVEKTANEAGYGVIVTSGEQDVARQRNQVKDFIVKGVDAIILCPCESKAIGTAIVEAQEAGIPVFTADIACLAPGVEVVSHVATDNLGGGRLAGEAMIEALGEGGGKVVILEYKDAESCLLRVRGFEETIDKHNETAAARIDVVMALPGNGLKEKGFRATEDALQAHPDLRGIFAINDPSALGAVAALEKAGKLGDVEIVAFDGQPEGKAAIKAGKIYADPVQFPDQIGRRAVETVLKHLAGEEVEREILIPTELYRKKDAMEDPTVP